MIGDFCSGGDITRDCHNFGIIYCERNFKKLSKCKCGPRVCTYIRCVAALCGPNV
jgi:hypothetical protein